MLTLNHFTQLKGLNPADFTGYRHVIGQSWDESVRDKLVDVDLIARYGLPQIEGPPELVRGDVAYTTAQYTAWKGKLSWWNGPIKYYHEFVDRYHKNEAWFLHDATGKRLISWNGSRAFYLMNPNSADFCKRYWLDTKAIMDANGWKHALVDNVGRDMSKLYEAPNSGAVEYKDNAQLYRDGWKQFGDISKLVLGADRLVLGNFIGDYDEREGMLDLLAHYDGCLLEQSCGISWPNKRKDWTPEKALRSLTHTREAIDTGKPVLCTLQCLSSDTAAYRAYALACYLLVADKQSSVRLVHDGQYTVPPVRIPEMDLELGEPLGRFEVTAQEYAERLFEQAQLHVDLKNMTFKVVSRQEPAPDPLAELKQQVAAVIEREQQKDRLIAELQARIDAHGTTVAELQQRLSVPISFSGTIKI